MRILAPAFILSLLLLSFCPATDKRIPHCKFKFDSKKSLKGIPEPSDIAYDKASNHYYIVSDHGILFETEISGKVIRKAKEEGRDFEGIEVTDSFVYVSDETPRKVYKYRKNDLSLVKVYTVQCGGATNKAFESITYNETKKCFVMVSESPVVVVEYDNDFNELKRYPFSHSRDISGARWHNGYMYLVGDLDMCILKCDPVTYKVLQAYQINVLNPEGMAFDASENVSVTSDDLQRIYFFKNLPDIK